MNTRSTLINRATNPTQYDLPDVSWSEEGAGIESPTRKYMWHYLSSNVNFQNKSILDIGSGTGWLLDLALKTGAKSAIGVEPSKKNAVLANKFFPHIITHNISLQGFKTKERFDLIFGIMSFIHMENIDEAFKQVKCLLKENGYLYLIVSDFEHYKKPRYDYRINIEPLSKETYAVSVLRPSGLLASIVRQTNVYKKSALISGLELINDIPMPPTDELIKQVPKYEECRNEPLTRLLIFKSAD